MKVHEKGRYHEVYARSLADPKGFWAEVAREIDWIEPAKKIFDPSLGAYGRWFTGAVVNTCYNALDRHVAGGRADQVALIHDSPLTNTISKFTFAEMVKDKPWTVETLTKMGGIEGLGATFLEENLSDATPDSKRSIHQAAARAVLKALLPDAGTNIRGQMRSLAMLREASGYNDRPQDFQDLIRILPSCD